VCGVCVWGCVCVCVWVCVCVGVCGCVCVCVCGVCVFLYQHVDLFILLWFSTMADLRRRTATTWISYFLLQFPVQNRTKTCAMLIKIQPDATVCRYLFTAKSLYMFRVSQHPSSVLKTATAATGTGHNTGTATSLQRGLQAVFSTPDDGCCDTWNMWGDFAVNKYLHTVASGWILINTELRCTEPRV